MRIEVRKLVREFDKIFGDDSLHHKHQPHIVDKDLVLDEGKQLTHYPVTTGNVIEVEKINQ